jgi:hypothetical protein
VFFVLNPNSEREVGAYMDVAEVTKSEAQKRIEQIQAFEREIAELRQQDILYLSPEQTAKIASHHSRLTTDLCNTFDIDINLQSKHLTLGMKIASLAGALAMASSLFFFFINFGDI